MGEGASRYSAHFYRMCGEMVLLTLRNALEVFAKTASRRPSSYRAYLMFRLAEESEMAPTILQIQKLTRAEPEYGKTAEVTKSPYEPPNSGGSGDSSSADSTWPTSWCAGFIRFSPMRRHPPLLGEHRPIRARGAGRSRAIWRPVDCAEHPPRGCPATPSASTELRGVFPAAPAFTGNSEMRPE